MPYLVRFYDARGFLVIEQACAQIPASFPASAVRMDVSQAQPVVGLRKRVPQRWGDGPSFDPREHAQALRQVGAL